MNFLVLLILVAAFLILLAFYLQDAEAEITERGPVSYSKSFHDKIHNINTSRVQTVPFESFIKFHNVGMNPYIQEKFLSDTRKNYDGTFYHVDIIYKNKNGDTFQEIRSYKKGTLDHVQFISTRNNGIVDLDVTHDILGITKFFKRVSNDQRGVQPSEYVIFDDVLSKTSMTSFIFRDSDDTITDQTIFYNYTKAICNIGVGSTIDGFKGDVISYKFETCLNTSTNKTKMIEHFSYPGPIVLKNMKLDGHYPKFEDYLSLFK